MKNLLKAALLATGLLVAAQIVKKTGHAISTGAKAVGHKTSEIAAKGDAKLVDKEYKEKQGPYGETVYINKNSHYYYVTKKGHRVYVPKSKLKDRM